MRHSVDTGGCHSSVYLYLLTSQLTDSYLSALSEPSAPCRYVVGGRREAEEAGFPGQRAAWLAWCSDQGRIPFSPELSGTADTCKAPTVFFFMQMSP